jgi:catalase-peroxidase
MAYKQKIWQQSFMGDLMVLVGTVPESAGFKTFGFAGGRVDVWEPQEDIYWGPERMCQCHENHTVVTLEIVS